MISRSDQETLCLTCLTKIPCFRGTDLPFLVEISRNRELPNILCIITIEQMPATVHLDKRLKRNWKISRGKWASPRKGGLTTFRRLSSKFCVMMRIRSRRLFDSRGLSSLFLKNGIRRVRMYQKEYLRLLGPPMTF